MPSKRIKFATAVLGKLYTCIMSVEYLSEISDNGSVTASYQRGECMQCSIPGFPISHFLQKFILPVVVCSVFFYYYFGRGYGNYV